MKCPFCDCETTKVVDKRDNREDGTTRRRRQCLRCSKRFTTYERIERVDVDILKKDGSLEKFDTQKIRKGLKKAVNDSIVDDHDIELFVEEIERYVLNSEDIVSSKEIGHMILDWLKEKDQMGYIRFASVYKDFKDIKDIKKEIEQLENI